MTTSSTHNIPDTFFTKKNTPISGKIKDSRLEDKYITFEILDSANYGYCTVDKNTGEWSYGPSRDFEGEDAFSIVAKGKNFTSYTFLININVSNEEIELNTEDIEFTAEDIELEALDATFYAQAAAPNAINFTPITNSAYLGYSYNVDPAAADVVTSSSSTVTVTTISAADLLTTGNFMKYTNKTYAGKGDVIGYTIIANNSGNVTANNVVITDLIPSGVTFVQNSLTINGVASTANPALGITLTSIPPGSSSSVAFSVLVSGVPSVNPLVNTASIVYTYTQDPSVPNGVSANNITNAVSTTITYADLSSSGNFIKTVSTAQATVANTFSYSFFVENTGNTTASNAVIYDTLPIGLSFIPGSLFVNNVPSSANPITGITLPDIAVGAIIPVTFSVSLDTLPTTNPMINTANIVYSFTQDPSVPLGITSTTASNSVSTAAIPNIIMTKTSSPVYALVGDTIVYTLSIQNPNNVALTSITINDPLAPQLSFVNGSVNINNVTLPNANIVNGVRVNTIAPNATTTVQFQAMLSNTTLDTIPNISNMTYSYAGSPNVVLTAQANSNVNILNVRSINVSITKSTPLTTVTSGGTIPYTVTIQNNGQLDLFDVVFRDIFSNKISLVTPSFTVNGTIVNVDAVTMQKGVDTGSLPVGSMTTITFVAYCKPCCQNNAKYNIVNSAYFMYNYVLPDLTGGMRYSTIATSTITRV